jgi:predicted site-specific integrase-resolvase
VVETKYLRPRDAAAMLGVAPQTLARWRVEGSPIPFVRVGRRAIRYDVKDLLAYAESMKVRSTSEPVLSASGATD